MPKVLLFVPLIFLSNQDKMLGALILMNRNKLSFRGVTGPGNRPLFYKWLNFVDVLYLNYRFDFQTVLFDKCWFKTLLTA